MCFVQKQDLELEYQLGSTVEDRWWAPLLEILEGVTGHVRTYPISIRRRGDARPPLSRARSRVFAMYRDDTRDLGYNPNGRGGLCQRLQSLRYERPAL